MKFTADEGKEVELDAKFVAGLDEYPRITSASQERGVLVDLDPYVHGGAIRVFISEAAIEGAKRILNVREGA